MLVVIEMLRQINSVVNFKNSFQKEMFVFCLDYRHKSK